MVKPISSYSPEEQANILEQNAEHFYEMESDFASDDWNYGLDDIDEQICSKKTDGKFKFEIDHEKIGWQSNSQGPFLERNQSYIFGSFNGEYGDGLEASVSMSAGNYYDGTEKDIDYWDVECLGANGEDWYDSPEEAEWPEEAVQAYERDIEYAMQTMKEIEDAIEKLMRQCSNYYMENDEKIDYLESNRLGVDDETLEIEYIPTQTEHDAAVGQQRFEFNESQAQENYLKYREAKLDKLLEDDKRGGCPEDWGKPNTADYAKENPNNIPQNEKELSESNALEMFKKTVSWDAEQQKFLHIKEESMKLTEKKKEDKSAPYQIYIGKEGASPYGSPIEDYKGAYKDAEKIFDKLGGEVTVCIKSISRKGAVVCNMIGDDIDPTLYGKPIQERTVREGESFPNKSSAFPYPEVRGEANTNGAKDVNHIQKNGAEAPKAESAGLRSGIYKPIKNYDWSKAKTGSLVESFLKEAKDSIYSEQQVALKIDISYDEGTSYAEMEETVEEFGNQYPHTQFGMEYENNFDPELGSTEIEIEGPISEVRAFLFDHFDEATAESTLAGARRKVDYDDPEYENVDDSQITDSVRENFYSMLEDALMDNTIDEDEYEMADRAFDEGNYGEAFNVLGVTLADVKGGK